ncbi:MULTISPECIES: hypothetical protein [Levilactobacillus]|uniref:Uncharacterized protein n=2 Tax=Levilactobacillus TaxID=2767886 RepID=A0A1Y6JWU6_9LACO|nr:MULTISPECIES: hypothetical protein [Levilactobacillus]KRK95532.1 hypothetical protein FD25_GL000915 [Levilactobacillus acidifarinae DSM 19394]KRL15113.1 hypothetical protein FD38_GL000925 [Levilactobacillus zymae DSM 19395]QFR61402.1 hypothetical protein LZ395_07705 [Levilactobacillus zymae]SMS13582.1 FIG00742663: hypothetical protein [Levilactobacillus zymae]GEO70223.1 hypothetical protein LAC03_21330 [Levilactobacillus acidifarinae]
MRGNFVYLSLEPVTNMVYSLGVSPADFLNGVPEVPNQLLLLNAEAGTDVTLNPHTRFQTIAGQAQVRRYLLAKHTAAVKWLDYVHADDLDFLLPSEIAELLYLGHMETHLRTPFYAKLQNEYAFLTLRDGFYKIYYRQLGNFNHVLDVSIKRHLRSMHNNRWVFARPLAISDVPHEILLQLTEGLMDGAVIAFDQLVERHRVYMIPVRAVHHPEHQATWHTQEEVYADSKEVASLRYDLTTREWALTIHDNQEFSEVADLI